TPAPAPAAKPPTPASQKPRHTGASDSWDLDADDMLPDESEAPAAPPAAPSRGPPPAASPRGGVAAAGGGGGGAGGGGGGGAEGRPGRGGGLGAAPYQSLSIRPPLSPVAEGDSEAGPSPPLSTGPVPGVQTFQKSKSAVDRPSPQGLLGGQSLLPQPGVFRSQESAAPTPSGTGAGAEKKEEGEVGMGGYMPSFASGQARAKSPLAGRRAGGGMLGAGATAPDGEGSLENEASHVA
ncbi:hypothetical protein DUNSADRAFT_3681, partial [Dunaliella salina]